MKNIGFNINSIGFNLILIFCGTLLSWIIGMKDLPDWIGFGGLVPLFTPIIITVLTISAFFIIRIFTKRYLWVISIIGVLWNVYSAIDFQNNIYKGMKAQNGRHQLNSKIKYIAEFKRQMGNQKNNAIKI